MSNNMGRSLVINLACTGAIPTRAMSPHVPVYHNEIVADVAACLELGVQIYHLHARDGSGAHTADPEPYGRLIEDIRKLPGGKKALLCVTTRDASGPISNPAHESLIWMAI